MKKKIAVLLVYSVIHIQQCIAQDQITSDLTVIPDTIPMIPGTFIDLARRNPDLCILRGSTGEKKVALTFDDGPSGMTQEILDILDSNGIKSTFFWQGKNLEENVDLVQSARENHQIANHSWDHANGLTSENEILWKTQVSRTNHRFDSLFGFQPKYFRPPFGAITEDQIKFLGVRGIRTVLWSVTSLDWDENQNSAAEIFQRFKDFLHPGAIVLLHDYDFGEPGSEMPEALELIINHGKSLGYEFVTVEELLN